MVVTSAIDEMKLCLNELFLLIKLDIVIISSINQRVCCTTKLQQMDKLACRWKLKLHSNWLIYWKPVCKFQLVLPVSSYYCWFRVQEFTYRSSKVGKDGTLLVCTFILAIGSICVVSLYLRACMDDEYATNQFYFIIVTVVPQILAGLETFMRLIINLVSCNKAISTPTTYKKSRQAHC